MHQKDLVVENMSQLKMLKPSDGLDGIKKL